MKGFWSDGISIQDMEKVTLNLLFSLSVLAILYKFITKDLSDVVMVQFSISIGGLLVARKFGSYFLKSKKVINDDMLEETNQTIDTNK